MVITKSIWFKTHSLLFVPLTAILDIFDYYIALWNCKGSEALLFLILRSKRI
jgi:hypothetical protein